MSKKTIFRIIFYLVLTFTIVIACIQLSFTFYLDKKIINDLQQEVVNQTKGEYEVKIGKLSTNIFNQSIYIRGFVLKPVNIHDSTSLKFFASASKIILVDFSLFSFIFRKDLTIASIHLVNPTGNIFRNSSPDRKFSGNAHNKFSIFNLIRKHIHSLRVLNIEIRNADFLVYDDYNDTVPSIASKENELKISNLRINKSIDAAGRLFMADTVSLIINNFLYTTKNGLYSLQVNHLTASYTESTLLLSSCKLIPNFTKEKFADETGKQSDRFQLSADRIYFKKIDVKLFFERNWFISHLLNIDNLTISAYRDKNDIRKPKTALPVQQLLKRIPFYTAIDSVKINDATIIYEEVAKGSTKPGRISFNEMTATITGITSDSTLFSKYNTLKINATCKLMNKGRLEAQYSFPLNTDKMVFDCSGKLGNIPMQAFNPILEESANVSVKDGNIDSMIFSFHANHIASKGKMELRYHQLKIAFLNKKDKKIGVVEELLSFLAHQFIIKENNPSANKPVRVTVISYQRDPTRFIFNYTWRSLLSGIKPAIGIPENSTGKSPVRLRL
jgi:hypothetical protein